MIPIHDLLSRIRLDADFARGRFVIGYWDRMAAGVLHADLREITWNADNPAFFDLVDEAGRVHSIPFHRVRAGTLRPSPSRWALMLYNQQVAVYFSIHSEDRIVPSEHKSPRVRATIHLHRTGGTSEQLGLAIQKKQEASICLG